LQGCTGGPIGTRSINAHKSTEGDGAVRETIVASLQLAEAALVKAGLLAPRTAQRDLTVLDTQTAQAPLSAMTIDDHAANCET